MKKGLLFFIVVLLFSAAYSQEKCVSSEYLQQQLQQHPLMIERMAAIENFTKLKIESGSVQRENGASGNPVIKIPVIVHVLYHTPDEKISDEKIANQIASLNMYFRRKNADTVNAPLYFRERAADVEIEFQLATSDPRRRSTSGIIKKYTPITKWTANDQMKFSSSMGDDAWDTKSYLNIWVCNLDKFAGYATPPGGEENKDGLVISFSAFGSGGATGLDMGKTAVHEIGHWLNLKHLWGDSNCGDDGVEDTPKQASYTIGCPSTVRITCGNGPYGDMYMNYMDFSSDACMNIFTKGQKQRMLSLFEAGGARYSLLASRGLSMPLIMESPIPTEDPTWLQPKLYPNPANSQITVDLSYDSRWIGKNIFVTNLQGQTIMNVVITSKKQLINISHLAAGLYVLAAKKDDGESMKMRFMKL